MQERWKQVDEYICNTLLPVDLVLDQVLKESANAGLPPHNVAPNQGKLLQVIAQIQGAKRILEVGTLGGYSTIWLARAIQDIPNGRVVTLEVNANHAAVAKKNISLAGLEDKVDIVVGAAVESLARLEGSEPFDLIFIDADKPSNPVYLQWSLKLSRKGTVIIADNVVRDGKVADAQSQDPNVLGIRTFNEMAALEPRLSATEVQTVGSKGWDGFGIAVVRS